MEFGPRETAILFFKTRKLNENEAVSQGDLALLVMRAAGRVQHTLYF